MLISRPHMSLFISMSAFGDTAIHEKRTVRSRDYRAYDSDQQIETVERQFSNFLEIVPYRFDDVGYMLSGFEGTTEIRSKE